MKSFFADLHIHIGRTERGQPVKISASKDLTFFHIAREAAERKGIGLIGIIDCHSPSVQEEIIHYLKQGEMAEVRGGGIRYRNTTMILGSEIEVRDPGMGPVHVLAYLPNLDGMMEFTQWMKRHMKNVELSSQRIYVPARVLQEEVLMRGGMLIPAHIFTPFRSVYGSGTDRMARLFQMDQIEAVELGLSSDTEMAGYLTELDSMTFLTNSDAHSLPKIGREYNELLMQEASFNELQLALKSEQGRRVTANFGLNPRLGKYHRSSCRSCGQLLDLASEGKPCKHCGSEKYTRGVLDRILQIADRKGPQNMDNHPPYHYQIPLQFIPGIGKRTLELLLDTFGTEMNILHRVSEADLARSVGVKTARYIRLAREGRLALKSGGGGIYGKINKEENE